MSVSSKFLTESTGEKKCENWSIFSKDMQNAIAYFLGHPVIRCIWYRTTVLSAFVANNDEVHE